MRREAVASGLVRVAQYVRKSTDHQKYSTANQSEAREVITKDATSSRF